METVKRKLFHVVWAIDVLAEDHVEAARAARRYQVCPESSARVFHVISSGQHKMAKHIVDITLKSKVVDLQYDPEEVERGQS